MGVKTRWLWLIRCLTSQLQSSGTQLTTDSAELVPGGDSPIQLLPGITLEVCADYCLVQSQQLLEVLSSAPLNGGFCKASNFLNWQVGTTTFRESPAATLLKQAQRLKLPGLSVAMMTAASMKSMRWAQRTQGSLGFTAVVTTGLANSRRAGDVADEEASPGTINLLLLSHQRLSPGAMVEAIAMATEAKAAALQNANILSAKSGLVATGTGTDCTAVACCPSPEELEYVGKHTRAGELLAKACVAAIEQSLEWYS